jgi:ectoine hydroxylase-related dioxygenase (phytanoyl-CoA dioxygenase family)
MSLSPEQLEQYASDGYTVLFDQLSASEVQMLKCEIAALHNQAEPGTTWERDGKTVRAFHGCHLTKAPFRQLTCLPRFVTVATTLLGTPVYVYQFKIHLKSAFSGEGWKWHQDYVYWQEEDGMPAPSAVNLMLFLDEVTEFNGPMILLAGSHRSGVLDPLIEPETAAPDHAGWHQHVSADLKYSLHPSIIAELARERAMIAPKGRAGTAVLFHPSLAHASGPNMSPFDRTTIFITYNSTANVPLRLTDRRPEFLVSRDSTAINPSRVDALVSC